MDLSFSAGGASTLFSDTGATVTVLTYSFPVQTSATTTRVLNSNIVTLSLRGDFTNTSLTATNAVTHYVVRTLAGSSNLFETDSFTTGATMGGVGIQFTELSLLSKAESRRLRAQAKLRLKEQARVRKRAAALLDEHLTSSQRLELQTRGYFTVHTFDTFGVVKTYRIRRGRHKNVDRVDAAGHVLETYCIHPRISCPEEDTMLAQKLMLECQEETFLDVANVTLQSRT